MNRHRLLILGLDGVPGELIAEFTGSGIMPHLASLLRRGRSVPMTVSLPEISSVSWSSFMTGTDAGNHGIFGFVDLVPGSYRFRFPNFLDLQTPTLFDALGERRKRSLVINLPATYPARPFPGVLVSGFVALQLEKAVFPASYLPLLKALDYQIDVDTGKGREQKMEFLADLHYSLKVRKAAADLLWKQEPWDLFMFTVTETDRLHHFLFDAWRDGSHPLHEEFLQLYQEVDGIIGDFCQKLEGDPGSEIVLLSDHGFCASEREIYVNPILKKHRFFDSSRVDQRTLETMHPESKAFAIDPARIFINLQGKFPRGRVKRTDYERIRRDLRDLFSELTVAGVKPVQKVLFKEEIYSPRLRDAAADLLLLGNPGSDLKAGLEKNETHGQNHFTGMHQWDNATFFCTRPELIPSPMTIFDARAVIERIMLEGEAATPYL